MRIICDEKAAVYTFVPVESGEEDVIAGLVANVKAGDKLEYRDRDQDDAKGRFWVVNLQRGDSKLALRGSTEADKNRVNSIRDTCYFGSGGLIFISQTDVDGKKAIVVTAGHCKLCGAAMIEMGRCEWGICKACSERCDHRYVRGAVHGGEAGDLHVGEFCDICGLPSR